jgi:hypothetical protein
MRRILLGLLVVVGCGGGSHHSTTPPPPLPEAKAEPTPPPAPKPEETKPPEPPAPAEPVELTLAAPKVSVKLVKAGSGKKAALKLTPKAGDKARVEIAMDFAGKTTAPAELGGTQEQVAPTVVLGGELQTQDVGADGAAKFQVTVDNVDAKDAAGAKTPADEFKKNLTSLNGMTIGGTVNNNGSTSDLTLRIEKPDPASKEALSLIHLSLLPMWPVLPKEPVAPGAKWTVTTTQKLADQLDVTQTTDYELVSHKGNDWVIKGTTKITGADQDITAGGGPSTKVGKIMGTGTTEATVSEGTLTPASKQHLETSFEATVNVPAQGDHPAQTVSLKFELKQGNAITSKQASAQK